MTTEGTHEHSHRHPDQVFHIHEHSEDEVHTYINGVPDDRFWHPYANRWSKDGPPVCSLEMLLEMSLEDIKRRQRHLEEKAALDALEREYEEAL